MMLNDTQLQPGKSQEYGQTAQLLLILGINLIASLDTPNIPQAQFLTWSLPTLQLLSFPCASCQALEATQFSRMFI